ncbi:hypothetical protein A3C18_01990 [Candidatus Kaiserbacteria bacterium RIFCSPHIGHO2_02_FULL_54_11b]|uniref:Uncharacterized protein n=2 Tax=Candidatus Kaiseribacteriota TaxID=1752734 RepID=A0A1F6DR22_9BACT|nr:MAG: hypothetical protein A3C18_01990 [Candidatus Kaiserbacteria bacterium RIFCSPHIGHO2_02_FULL_54_11b]
MFYHTSTSLVMLVVALCAWGLVGFFAWNIGVDESQRLVGAQDAQRATIAGASSARTHALALETAEEGTALKGLLNVDIVSTSNMIEAVGKAAGVSVKLGDALPENLPVSDGIPLKAIGFVVAVDGRFPALMRAARLFETLPIPSTVTRLDIEHAPRGAGKTSDIWHMNVYIRVLTTSDISS